MNKDQKASYLRTILLFTYSLIGIGLLMNFSISPAASNSLSLNIFYRQLLYVGIGTFFLIFFTYFNHKKLKKVSTVLFFLLVASLLLVLIKGEGAHRLIDIGLPFTFQPSQYANLILTILIAKVVSEKSKEEYNQEIFIILFLIVIFVSGLVAIEPDMGDAAIIFLTNITLLFICGIKTRDFFMVLTPTSVLGVIAVLYRDKWKQRIVYFFHPHQSPLDAGYQALQSFRAIARGGVTGAGFMRSIFKYGDLPENTSDFIFAIIGEEFGIIGCILLITLFVVLLYTGFKIVKNAESSFSRLLAAGIMLNIATASIVNISTNIGLLPVTGIVLPFISYGGNSMLSNLIGIGIIMNIVRTNGE